MPGFGARCILFFITTAVCMILMVSEGAANAANIAPDFTLLNLEGKNVSLSSYRGKIVVLNFWGTWCEPCKAEMPSLNKIYLKYRNKGFVVLAIALDPSEQNVKSFIAEKAFSFPVLLDNKKEVYFDKYGLFGLPISIIIDRNGAIVQKVIGETTWDSPQMEDKIQKLLGGK